MEKAALMEPQEIKIFDYFKELADSNDLKNANGESLLSKKYEQIHINEESVLSNFLSGKLTLNDKNSTSEIPIFPFGFNLSQKEAVEKAFNSKLSIVEGPPGTGKTQTILNLIANAVIYNKKVAVASSNNSAISNVFEKLQRDELDFFVAFLGGTSEKDGEKVNRKTEFVNQQSDFLNLRKWKINQKQKEKIWGDIQELFKVLQSKLVMKNNLAELEQKLEDIKLERKYFVEDYGKQFDTESEITLRKKLSSQNFLELWIRYESLIEQNKRFNLWRQIVNYFKLGIRNQEIYNHKSEEFIFLCQKKFYDEVIRETEFQIRSYKEELEGFSFDDKLKTYRQLSMTYFKTILYDKYDGRKRQTFTENGSKASGNLWLNSQDVLKEYPVILSTTFSLTTIFNDSPLYDYVILDEASQVDLATGALALSCAQNAVIVGDLKQLPNVVTTEGKIKTEQIFGKYNLPEAYRYYNHSLLQSLKELFPEAASTLLREHYRCHPKIIGFCNKKFYNNELIVLSDVKEKTGEAPLAVYKTVPGEHTRWKVVKKNVNRREIEEIQEMQKIQEILSGRAGTSEDIGITTPYRNQADELKKSFEEYGIMSDTVDKYQGREKDTMILSAVDNKLTSFADSANRINVAVSRAIRRFILVVNGNGEEERDTNIGDLIRYIQYNNFEIHESKIYSVFDYLFKARQEEKAKYLKGEKQVSRFDSENLMYRLIEDILKEERFSKYQVVPHYPLSNLLRDFELSELSEQEKRYAKPHNTHIDFIIENEMDKSPVLAIEVDGVTFHHEGTEQFKRDEMKNHILKVYGIKLQRFSTDGSREKEKLESLLDKALNSQNNRDTMN